MRHHPLRGLRIIELCEVWAGPTGCSLLGDLGAEVVKVESFPRASMTRAVRTPPPGRARGYAGPLDAPRPWERSSTHNMANRNKLGVTLNLATAEGRDLLQRLVAVSDAVVDGYSGGTMDKLGCGYEAMRAAKPDIVWLSMPGWGVRGPYSGYVTLGSGLDATSGHWMLRGYPGDDANRTASVFHTDATGANAIVVAVMTALFHRRRTGRGQCIDLSQMEVFLPHLARPFMDAAMNGREWPRTGNRDTAMAPHNVYRCAGEDRWVAIAVQNDAQWQALVRALGDPPWAREARFGDAIGRLRHEDELDAGIAAWTSRHDPYHAMHTLNAAGVPAMIVANEADGAHDPHLVARRFFEEVELPSGIRATHCGPLWQFSDVRLSITRPPATVGQHNRDVFGGLLGLTDAELDELARRQVIGDTYTLESEVDPVDRATVTPR